MKADPSLVSRGAHPSPGVTISIILIVIVVVFIVIMIAIITLVRELARELSAKITDELGCYSGGVLVNEVCYCFVH